MVDGWITRSIGNLTEVYSGGTPSTGVSDYWGGDIPWMSSGELHQKRVKEVAGRITQLGYNASSARWVPPRSVLLGLAGQGKTRATAAYLEIPLCTNQSIAAILPNDSVYNSEYLYYVLDSKYEELRSLSADGRGGLTKEAIMAFEIDLPKDIDEQCIIAEALSDVESLITLLEALVKKKRDIKQGVIHDLLTGKRSLPGSDGKFEILKVGEIGALRRGAGISRAEAYSGNKPCIRYGDLYTSYGPYTTSTVGGVSSDVAEKSTRIQYGDIVFAATGETKEDIGKCTAYLIGRDGYASGDTLVLIPSIDVNPIYLAYVLNSRPAQEQKAKLANGDTVVHLSLTALGSVSVELPSKHDQDAIANVILDFDDSIVALEQKLTKYRLIKQGMMEKLLSGAVRLV